MASRKDVHARSATYDGDYGIHPPAGLTFIVPKIGRLDQN